jgi:hypothetical protein
LFGGFDNKIKAAIDEGIRGLPLLIRNIKPENIIISDYFRQGRH